MTPLIKILHFESNAFDTEVIKRQLEKSKINFEYKQVEKQTTFVKAIKEFGPDIVLTDHSLPAFDSWKVLEIIAKEHKNIPVIVITRSVSETFAAETIQKGAYDYFIKSNIFRLTNTIENALEKIKLENDRQTYINELEKTSELLKETEKLAHLGSWSMNMETFETRWSDEAYRILGYEPGEIKASYQTFSGFIHPADRETFNNMTSDTTVAENDEIKFSFRIIDKNKKVKYIRNELFISKGEKGKVIKLTGFNLDITREKEIELKLIESEQRYRNLFETNPLPMFVLEKDSLTFLDANMAALNQYGYSREEFLNMTAFDIRSAEEKKRFIDMRSTNPTFYKIGAWEHYKKDGTKMMVKVHADDMLFEGRKARIVFVMDVTEKTNTAKSLKKPGIKLNS